MRIKSVKHTTRNLSLSVGAAIAISLTGCGGSNSDTDLKAVDTSAPVEDWVMIWNDEFDGDSIDSTKWSHEVNCSGGGNNEQQCYTDSSENSFVADGMLNIVAKPAEEGAELPYTSARLRTKYKGDWTYGRFEMRAKLPSGQGSWPAFWMLPTDEVYGSWPKSGEIDIIEAVNLGVVDADGNEEKYVHGTLHYGRDWPQNESSGKEYLLPDGANPADDFHTYAIEWQEGEIRWYVDGYLYATQMASEVRYNSKGEASGLVHQGWFSEYFDIATGEKEVHWDAAPFDQDFHILLNLAVGGDWPSNVNNLGIDETAFANGQSYIIDYVRVYECSTNPMTGKGCETVRGGYKDEDDALVTGKAPIPEPPSTGVVQELTVFADAANPDWPIWDCCGGSTPTIETDDAEHGAVAEFVIGAAPTVMGFNTTLLDTPVRFDASPMLTAGALTFEMKVVSLPSDANAVWKFKIESNSASQAVELDITQDVDGNPLTAGTWQTYSFSMQDLADAGLDLTGIDVIMIFPAWGTGEGATYRVDNVKFAIDYPELVLFADQTNMEWPLWDCCGGSTPVEAIDDEEHGTVAEFSIGETPTVMGFLSGDGVKFDASLLEAVGVIQFEMKVVTGAANDTTPWLFKVESNGAAQAVELDLSASNEGVAPVTGEWQTYTFNLQDLADAGLDLSAIDVVMIFPAWGAGEGAVYRVDNAKIFNPPPPSITLFADQENAQWPMWDCCGGSTPTVEIDGDAAHGATAEFQIGATPTVMGFLAEDGAEFDATTLLTSGVIQFDMKVIATPSETTAWVFKVESLGAETAVELALEASKEGEVPVTGEWQTYTFDLLTLSDAGLDISAIDVLMIFPAWGTGDGAIYRIDNVKITSE
ncbi:family 16 glycosylhydrolase [Alteromonas sp. M12]|uniref:family 16 glycosylhydrolase n=1 Tax=Alteromonas sp. M12 TaxID=3135644 RepID=UPI00319D8874